MQILPLVIGKPIRADDPTWLLLDRKNMGLGDTYQVLLTAETPPVCSLPFSVSVLFAGEFLGYSRLFKTLDEARRDFFRR